MTPKRQHLLDLVKYLKAVYWLFKLDITLPLPEHGFEIDYIESQYPRRGNGRKAIQELCEFADLYGLIIFIQPSDIYGTPLEVLIPFYESFGFISCKLRPDIMQGINSRGYYFREPRDDGTALFI